MMMIQSNMYERMRRFDSCAMTGEREGGCEGIYIAKTKSQPMPIYTSWQHGISLAGYIICIYNRKRKTRSSASEKRMTELTRVERRRPIIHLSSIAGRGVGEEKAATALALVRNRRDSSHVSLVQTMRVVHRADTVRPTYFAIQDDAGTRIISIIAYILRSLKILPRFLLFIITVRRCTDTS